MLLNRHDMSPAQFALEQVPEPEMLTMHVVGYHFDREDARKKVLAWWEQTKGKPKAPAGRQ